MESQKRTLIYGHPWLIIDIHNLIVDIHNSIMDIHNSIMDIHNCIMSKYGWAIMEFASCSRKMAQVSICDYRYP